MTEDRWQRRIDLTFHWVGGLGRSDGYWVVKDPLSRHWHCLTTTEKQILDLADGTRSLRELCVAAVVLVKPMKANLDAFAAFFLHARQRGLLVANGMAGPIECQIRNRGRLGKRTSSLINLPAKLLFFRFPGIHLNRPTTVKIASLLERYVKGVLIVAAVLISFAIALWVANWSTFWIEISLASSRQGPTWWLTFFAAIAIAKTIHELAHIVACRVVGAECREVGLMLLLGIPCLYCDVSDLWTVPSRRSRVFVSAAGMLAESFIAALATLIWIMTAPSMLHDVALMLMVVCSISTILINANPLLRYDGYFILSDALGVPNLFARSMSWLTVGCRRMIWGGDQVERFEHHVGWRIPTAWLAVYAIASVAYRAFLFTAIAILMIHVMTEIGLGWLGWLFAGSLVGSMGFRALYAIAKPPDSKMAQSESSATWLKSPRAMIGMTVIAVTVSAALFIPLPRTVRVPVMIVGRDEVSVYAPESGMIRSRPTGPVEVSSGDVLFRIVDFALEDQWLAAAADLAEAKAVAAAWQKRRGGADRASDGIVLANKRVQLAQDEYAQVKRRRDRLVIRAPMDGWFIEGESATETTPKNQSATSRLSDLTSGERVRGSYVQQGTVLGTVARVAQRDGIAQVGAANADGITAGQPVTLLHRAIAAGQTEGTIDRVANAATETLPALKESDSQPSDVDGSNFIIRIRWDESSSIPLAIGSVGIARIECEPCSLVFRLRRLFSSELRR